MQLLELPEEFLPDLTALHQISTPDLFKDLRHLFNSVRAFETNSLDDTERAKLFASKVQSQLLSARAAMEQVDQLGCDMWSIWISCGEWFGESVSALPNNATGRLSDKEANEDLMQSSPERNTSWEKLQKPEALFSTLKNFFAIFLETWQQQRAKLAATKRAEERKKREQEDVASRKSSTKDDTESVDHMSSFMSQLKKIRIAATGTEDGAGVQRFSEVESEWQANRPVSNDSNDWGTTLNCKDCSLPLDHCECAF